MWLRRVGFQPSADLIQPAELSNHNNPIKLSNNKNIDKNFILLDTF